MTEEDHSGTSKNDAFQGLRDAAKRIADMSVPSLKISTPLDGLMDAIQRQTDNAHHIQLAMEAIDWSDTPAQRSANAAEETRELIAQMASLTKDIVDLTQQSLAASESARADAAKSQKFARGATIASIVIAFASLAAAVTAIIVSL